MKRLMGAPLKSITLITLLSLSLMLGVASVVAAACRGGGEPAPPTETSTPLPTQTSTPLPTSTPVSPHLNTPLGPFALTYVKTGQKSGDYTAVAGRQFLFVGFELGGLVPISKSSLEGLQDYGQGSYVMSADGHKWELFAGGRGQINEKVVLDFAFLVSADAVGFVLYVPGNDPIVLPTPSAAATATPPPTLTPTGPGYNKFPTTEPPK